jgi:hypothetical protein
MRGLSRGEVLTVHTRFLPKVFGMIDFCDFTDKAHFTKRK